ncbi:hypothetical protein RZS08_14995, partial [Arthrospira platensis SPKY1]|nr:hypothetical protein [Arthrospira platensis SPKY1]
RLLIQYDTFGIDYYPALYRDLAGKLLDGYWYIKFLEELEVCDLARSTYYPDEIDEETGEPLLDRIALDPAKLALVAEEQRLLFRLGGIQNPRFLVHERLRMQLESMGATGVIFFKVSEFEFGMQFQ